MRFPADEALKAALQKREAQQNRRVLPIHQAKAIDFCSNDYLGFAQSASIAQRSQAKHLEQAGKIGATGSRLISGNFPQIARLEEQLAELHQAEAALLFNSGYTANLGLLACIATRHDTILYDELVHASIRDGLQLSQARTFSFRHNQIESLQQKLDHAEGQIFVVVESVYSMDGDEAPLKALVDLAQKRSFQLIVDEAHALGVVGRYGLVQALGLEEAVFARVFTFGKALGAHGAAILGSRLLCDYLINFCRAFIYTTAAPPYHISHLEAAYEELQTTKAIAQLRQRIAYFREHIPSDLAPYFLSSQTAIQSFVLPSNEALRTLAAFLLTEGIQTKAILHPTVPKGKERIRISIRANHQLTEIDQLLALLVRWIRTNDFKTMIENKEDESKHRHKNLG